MIIFLRKIQRCSVSTPASTLNNTSVMLNSVNTIDNTGYSSLSHHQKITWFFPPIFYAHLWPAVKWPHAFVYNRPSHLASSILFTIYQVYLKQAGLVTVSGQIFYNNKKFFCLFLNVTSTLLCTLLCINQKSSCIICFYQTYLHTSRTQSQTFK